MFDSFSYKYQKAGVNTVSNRLYHVNDDVSMTGIMTDDIDDEGTYSDASETINSLNNYGYDEIGNLKFDKVEGIDTIVWTAYGKVKRIVRIAGYYKTINDVNVYPSNLEFMYDAMGNRIAKIEKPRDANGEKSSADWKTTYYIRDAQGNPMATYKKSSETEAASFKLIEHPIYGSSRVGIDNYSLEFVGYTAPSNGLTSRVLGLKQYELTNHLGNVLTTISDKRIPVENNGVVDHYVADITTASDYYPFGSPMDGRTFSSEKYRFGYNGKELDNEIQGGGNSYDFGARIYDSRLGRWMAVDPMAAKYPDLSPYCFAGNLPTLFVDIDGKRFVNTYWDKVNKVQNKLNDAQAVYEKYKENNKTISQKELENSKEYALVQSLQNELNKNIKYAQEVDEYLYTLCVTNRDEYEYFDLLTDSEGKEIIVEVVLHDEPDPLGHQGYTKGFAKYTNYKPTASVGGFIIHLFYKKADMEAHSGRNYRTFANELGDIKYFMTKVYDPVSFKLWDETSESTNADGSRNKQYFDNKEGAGYQSTEYEEARVKDVKNYKPSSNETKSATKNTISLKK